jgi:hypothetical protein
MSKSNGLTRISTLMGFATPFDPDSEWDIYPESGTSTCHPDRSTGDSAVCAGTMAELDAMSPGIMLPGDRVVLRRATRTSAWFVRGIA